MVSFVPFDSYTLYLSSSQGSLNHKERNMMEIFFLGLSVPKFLNQHIMSVCGTLYFSLLLQEEASLMMVEQGTDL